MIHVELCHALTVISMLSLFFWYRAKPLLCASVKCCILNFGYNTVSWGSDQRVRMCFETTAFHEAEACGQLKKLIDTRSHQWLKLCYFLASVKEQEGSCRMQTLAKYKFSTVLSLDFSARFATSLCHLPQYRRKSGGPAMAYETAFLLIDWLIRFFRLRFINFWI